MASRIWRSGFPISKFVAAVVLISLWVLSPAIRTRAATPPSGTISSGGTVSWDFAPVVGGTVIDVDLIEANCPAGPCDNFDLTVVLPSTSTTFYQTNTGKLSIHYSWSSSLPTDLDLFAFSPSGAKQGPGSPDTTASGANFEDLVITDPKAGAWHIRSVASTAPLPTSAHAVATLTFAPRPVVPPPPPPPPGAPQFVNYPMPENIAPACIPGDGGLVCSQATKDSAGEPSIGVDWNTGRAFIEAGNHTLRVTFNDAVTPASATWEDKRSPFSRVSLDPILFTDSLNGGTQRTFASQLDGACSETSFTDPPSDGDSWSPSQGCGTPAGIDHQTIGGGPYASPPPQMRSFPHAIYYCSQSIATAFCARSDNGGFTFGIGVPLYTFVSGPPDVPSGIGTCGGLHGHIRVAPDGTAYVPNHDCRDANNVDRVGMVVSTNNGSTWTVKTVPDSNTNRNGGDPSVAAGANNTLYLGYVNRDGHAKIAVSHDRGDHWTKSKDVGTPFGIENAEFPEVIAGDDNRAAFAFLGTRTPGDTQSATFPGVWHLYVAFTYNGGGSWTTVDATPNDPVQRGCIWNGGGSNQCRNLLDFNDITIDRCGRVLVGYADGCIGGCVTDPTQNQFNALATIARQVAGRGLFAAFDNTNFCVGGTGGGGKRCTGEPGNGISGDPDCDDHDSDDDPD